MKKSLIDHFNAFHIRSQELELSANARSLFFAILGEFNKAQYPAHIKIQNTYLQHLSGIKSTCSFSSDRNALINAGLISHSNQVYTLETFQKDNRNTLESYQKGSRKVLEREQKDFRKVVESPLNTTSMSKITIEKEKEIEIEEEGESPAPARENLSTNSTEVLKAWYGNKGEQLAGAKAFALIQDEKLYGTEAVIKAIETASTTNNYEAFPKVTYTYFKIKLEDQLKGGKPNGNSSRNNLVFIDNSQYAGTDFG